MPGFHILYVWQTAIIAVGLVVVFLLLRWILPFMFRHEWRACAEDRHTIRSVMGVLVASAISFGASGLIVDLWWWSFVRHFLGGGCTGVLVCFLAVRESVPHIGARRFALFALPWVTILGVANEMAEFAVQSFTSLNFTPNQDDIEWDLLSNEFGIFASLPVFAFLAHRQKDSGAGL